MKNDQKIVKFDRYCQNCKHYNKSESEDPCWDCLENPVNTYSHKPVYFEEDKKK